MATSNDGLAAAAWLSQACDAVHSVVRQRALRAVAGLSERSEALSSLFARRCFPALVKVICDVGGVYRTSSRHLAALALQKVCAGYPEGFAALAAGGAATALGEASATLDSPTKALVGDVLYSIKSQQRTARLLQHSGIPVEDSAALVDHGPPPPPNIFLLQGSDSLPHSRTPSPLHSLPSPSPPHATAALHDVNATHRRPRHAAPWGDESGVPASESGSFHSPLRTSQRATQHHSPSGSREEDGIQRLLQRLVESNARTYAQAKELVEVCAENERAISSLRGALHAREQKHEANLEELRQLKRQRK